MVLLIMGVAGVGKSTIGTAVAQELDWTFLEADDDHSKENIAKMSKGIALTDADRAGWLQSLRSRMVQHVERGENIVVACSALKEKYRVYLEDVPTETRIVYLKADRAVLEQRLRERKNHFAHVNLLESQLDTLEPPEHALVIDATRPLQQNVEDIVRAVSTAG